MQFRPCIDIHNGMVKQIVGSSLRDAGDTAEENFVASKDASFFAGLYRDHPIEGAHVILLNGKDSPHYEKTKQQACAALAAYPHHMQAGGGITLENAQDFLDAGADKVIVTSYVFRDGGVCEENLRNLSREIGRNRLVLDVSCREKNGAYYIVTDRWQKFTNVTLNHDTLDYFAGYCSEFLVHAVDVEGKSCGIEENLVRLLGEWNRIPVTYAGGVHSYEDLEKLDMLGRGRIHVTIGSALDLFGGEMRFEEVLQWCRSREGCIRSVVDQDAY